MQLMKFYNKSISECMYSKACMNMHTGFWNSEVSLYGTKDVHGKAGIFL